MEWVNFFNYAKILMNMYNFENKMYKNDLMSVCNFNDKMQ